MSDAGFEARYDPSFAEIRRGMALVSRGIYSGRWRVAAFAFSMLRGAGFGVLAALIAIVLLHKFGIDWLVRPVSFFGVFLAFAFSLLAFQRVIFNRSVSAYLTAPNLQGQRLSISPRGIALDNGRSQSLTDWRDVKTLVATKGMLVAVYGNQGLVIPDRLFAAQGGDTGGLRERVQAWHAAAQDGTT